MHCYSDAFIKLEYIKVINVIIIAFEVEDNYNDGIDVQFNGEAIYRYSYMSVGV